MGTSDQYRDIEGSGESGGAGGLETALRSELAARAGGLAVGSAPYPAVLRAVRRSRARRQAAAATGLVLVVALGVAVPFGIHSGHGHGNPAVGSVASGTPSPLLTIPLRGNLAGDSAFLAAMQQRPVTNAPAGSNGNQTASPFVILYANDDGATRMVVTATFDGTENLFDVFTGPHGAAAASLKLVSDSSQQPGPSTFTFVGQFADVAGSGDGSGPVPFVVLGPTRMTDVEYATGVTLTVTDGRLARVRTNIVQPTTVDGTATGEIPQPTTAPAADALFRNLVFRADIDGKHVDTDPESRTASATPDDNTAANDADAAADRAIRTAVALAATHAGLPMDPTDVGGDSVLDNSDLVLDDLAHYGNVPISAVSYQVDWVGQETSAWDSALVDVQVPGLPNLQIFVRGEVARTPTDTSPEEADSFVRPAVALTSGHLPETAQAFGGTPEATLVGFQTMDTW